MKNARKTPESIAFGQRLTNLKIASGLTWMAIACETGIDARNLSAWANGIDAREGAAINGRGKAVLRWRKERAPTTWEIGALARLLKVRVGALR